MPLDRVHQCLGVIRTWETDEDGKAIRVARPCGKVLRISVEQVESYGTTHGHVIECIGCTCYISRKRRSQYSAAKGYRTVTHNRSWNFTFVHCWECKRRVAWQKFKEPIL